MAYPDAFHVEWYPDKLLVLKSRSIFKHSFTDSGLVYKHARFC